MTVYEAMAIMTMVLHIVVDLLIALNNSTKKQPFLPGTTVTFCSCTFRLTVRDTPPAPLYLYYTTFCPHVNTPNNL